MCVANVMWTFWRDVSVTDRLFGEAIYNTTLSQVGGKIQKCGSVEVQMFQRVKSRGWCGRKPNPKLTPNPCRKTVQLSSSSTPPQTFVLDYTMWLLHTPTQASSTSNHLSCWFEHMLAWSVASVVGLSKHPGIPHRSYKLSKYLGLSSLDHITGPSALRKWLIPATKCHPWT